MAILGFRHTGNFVTNERPENWRQAILRNYPNGTAPLFALTSLMKQESTDDPVFHWWQKSYDDRRFKIGTAILSGDTSIALDTAFKTSFIAKAGDMILLEQTGEIVRVSTDPTDPALLPVVRAQAGTSAAAVNIATSGVSFYMLIIGSAYPEGSMPPSGVNYDPVDQYNYTQIFRNTLEITRTASKTRLRTGDQVKEAKRECAEIHSTDIERALWFGKRSTGSLDGKPFRTTAGIEAQIIAGAPDNVLAAPGGGAITASWLETQLELAFRKGSSEKMVFCSNVFLLALNQLARKNSTYNIDSTVKEYGMRVSRAVSPFGELVIKTHPLFNNIRGGTNTTAFTSKANNAYILDMGEFIYRHLSGDDMRYEKDLAPTGLDGMKSGYITECGVELQHPENHFILTGIVSGAADA